MPTTSCKICHSATRMLRDQKSSKIYHVCDACDFIALDERFIIPPDEEKRRYQFHNNTFENAGYVAMFEHFIQHVIIPYCGSVETALDFGCGTTPVLATLLKKHFVNVDYYDPYFYPEQSFMTKKFDLITATEVVEHLQEPTETLRMLAALLNPGGGLALMTKFHTCKDDVFLKWWYRIDDTHIAFYSKRTIEYLSGALGLDMKFIGDGVCYLERKT